MAKESAEEKLLKLMKKSSPSVAVNPAQVTPVKKKFKFTFSITLLNIFLFIGIVVCTIALGSELISGSALLNQAVKFSGESKIGVSLSVIALPSTPKVDYFLQNINERNIFKPYVPKIAKAAAEQGLTQQMSKYKLVGIAWLDLPETASVMVVDIQKNKTIFLKAGEKLGDITVKTIFTDRAVFSWENQEKTIKL